MGLPGGGLGGFWGALGPPLGPLGASFGAPRDVLGSLGRFWGRSGRNLDQQMFRGLIFGLFGPVWGCLFAVFSLLARGVAGAVCCTVFGPFRNARNKSNDEKNIGTQNEPKPVQQTAPATPPSKQRKSLKITLQTGLKGFNIRSNSVCVSSCLPDRPQDRHRDAPKHTK